MECILLIRSFGWLLTHPFPFPKSAVAPLVWNIPPNVCSIRQFCCCISQSLNLGQRLWLCADWVWCGLILLMLGPQLPPIFPIYLFKYFWGGGLVGNFQMSSLLCYDRAAAFILHFQVASMLSPIFALLSTVASHAFIMVNPGLKPIKLHKVAACTCDLLWW